MFASFDRDGNGFITEDELFLGMANIGIKLEADEGQIMIRDADTDGDGKINYVEFMKMFSGGI